MKNVRHIYAASTTNLRNEDIGRAPYPMCLQRWDGHCARFLFCAENLNTTMVDLAWV